MRLVCLVLQLVTCSLLLAAGQVRGSLGRPSAGARSSARVFATSVVEEPHHSNQNGNGIVWLQAYASSVV